ncbi:hypothetical protein ACEQPO_26760 [Bacillus sp. SL00103]
MKSRIEQDIASVIKRVKSFAGKVMISCSTHFHFGPSAISACLMYVEGLTEFECFPNKSFSPMQKELDITEVDPSTLPALSKTFFGIQNDVLEDMNLAIEQLYSGRAIFL